MQAFVPGLRRNSFDDPELIRSRVIEDPNGCWIWQRNILAHGYGQLFIGGKPWAAHRASWTQVNGPIPAGMYIDHLCRLKACVNPAHLEPVTPAENSRRWGRSLTHCARDHEYTEENSYYYNNGRKRRCRKCRADEFRRWNSKRKQIA